MPSEPPRFDPERNLAVLDRHRVDYVMVGGFVQRCTDVSVDGIVIHLASLDDIIDSKTHADRPKNREALLELHQDHLVSRLGRSRSPSEATSW